MQGLFYSKPQNLLNAVFNRSIGMRHDSNGKRKEAKISQVKFESNLTLYEKVLFKKIPGTLNYFSDSYLFSKQNKSVILQLDVPNRKLDPAITIPIEQAEKNVLTTINYSSPRDICNCSNGHCSCSTKYILVLTKDQWLYQVNLNTGALMRRIYVNPENSDMNDFQYLEWNLYGLDFTLQSPVLRDDRFIGKYTASLAVFTANTFQFKHMLSLDIGTFGFKFKSVKITQDLLFVELYDKTIQVYRFSEFLKNGKPIHTSFCPPAPGCPVGLAIDFQVMKAPPVLFTIHMSLVSLFELIPCCNTYRYFVIERALQVLVKLPPSALEYARENSSQLTFHPDQTDRFIVHGLEQLCIVQPSLGNSPATAVSVLHSDELNLGEDVLLPLFVSWPVKEPIGARTVAWAYDKNLDTLAILLSHCLHDGRIRIYKNSDLKFVKEILMRQRTLPEFECQLSYDNDLIIILEKGSSRSRFTAFKLISTERTEDGYELISID